MAKARLAVLAPWPMAFRRKILVAGVDANMIVDDLGFLIIIVRHNDLQIYDLKKLV